MIQKLKVRLKKKEIPYNFYQNVQKRSPYWTKEVPKTRKQNQR